MIRRSPLGSVVAALVGALALAAPGVASAQQERSQDAAQGVVTVEVLESGIFERRGLRAVTPLDFGGVEPGTSETVAPEDTAAEGGASKFTLTDSPGRQYVVSMPFAPVVLDGLNGAPAATISGFQPRSPGAGVGSDGFSTVTVGATVAVDPDAAPGVYEGGYPVTLSGY